MAHLDHKEAFDELKTRVLDGLRSHFPVNGRLQTLELEDLEVRDEAFHSDDIRGQLTAKTTGQSWSAPVYGTMVLRNNESGKVVERKKIRLADIPMMTRRYSYIVDGQEYQVDNQWQLKPGAYVRRLQTGEVVSEFNVPNKRSFKIQFDPESKLFTMTRGQSKDIPVYPLMKTLGVDDDTLEKSWGKDIFSANRAARGASGALAKFFKADRKRQPNSHEEAEKYLVDTLAQSQMRPDSTEITLGKPFSNVDSDAMLRATGKMLKVQTGHPEDDRDSLIFKDLRSLSDFVHDRLTDYRTRTSVADKMLRKVNQAVGVRDVVKFDTFNEPIRQTFANKPGMPTMARTASQMNPVEMISSSLRTTIMGPGGISSADKVLDEAKLINKSHFGFLDPLHTPEGPSTGITLHLPMGVKKVGKEPTIPVYNLQTQKMDRISPRTFLQSTVVLPDQVDWSSGQPKPVASTVKVSREGNEVGEADFKNAQYVLRHSSQLFDVTSNLIPFLGNTSGNRASYATHHIDQAISLRDREAPLVQVSTGANRPGLSSFEELLGKQTAHTSPVDGKVIAVKDDAVVIQAKNGDKREVQIYRNFPLNDTKGVLDSTPLVKPGDTVTTGQTIADTNFTKGGKLALGTNLTVAYVPFKGYNFEDGVVISQSAAQKLSSVHLHKPSFVIDEKTVTNPGKFEVQHPEAFTKKQYGALGTDGIVRVGSRVKPGDPLVLATKPFELKDKTGRQAIRKSNLGAHTDISMRWDSDYEGEVVSVHKAKSGEVTVHVRTIEPMQVGDKIAGRYGNKGIVTLVLPDDQMPRTKSGEHVQVALNPSGVPGRVNVGQVLETAVAKIAKKTGKPYVVDNLGHTQDMLAKVQSELKKHGFEDTEELYDPSTGVSIGKALMGPQYMLKLTHQVDKKVAARSGMNIPGSAPEYYDHNLMPMGGGKTGGQSIGNLGMYTLLAHGARANIREIQTWKSEGDDPSPDHKRWPSQHEEVWRRIQMGDPLPTPTPTFAFQKFTDMLRVAGINVEKKGHRLQLTPLTDKQTLRMSNGEVKDPSQLTDATVDKTTGELKPHAGGLFDPHLTGGHGGRKWTHFTLAEPMPNPVFEGAIQKLLGLTQAQYTDIVTGAKAIDAQGNIARLGTKGTVTGGPAIVKMLSEIDVKKELGRAQKELNSIVIPDNFAHRGATPKLDKTLKRVKYLRALDELNMTPQEAYTLKHVPVIPPAMRPATLGADGNAQWADLNGLYKDIGALNNKMRDPNFQKYLGDEDKQEQRASMYDGLKALMGVGMSYADRQNKNKGSLLQISGAAPKLGMFQRTLLSRRQDLSMRSTIIPEPAMGVDQVGLPAEKALVLFRPFVVKQMVDMGVAPAALDAQKMLSSKEAHKDTGILRALDKAMAERPVLLKRDPALHKHSIMAFNAFRVPGRAIQIHPLVTGGYNADFDGDAMSVYVPIHPEAIAEARNMFPSNNLFNEATGKVMAVPTLESALGLYKMSRVTGDSKKSFNTAAEALRAVETGKMRVDELADIKGVGKTTMGRLIISSAVPQPLQKKVLEDHQFVLDKKGLADLYTTIAKEHRADFGDAANRLKDIGYGAAFGAVKVPHPDFVGPAAIRAAEDQKSFVKFLPIGTHTLALSDFQPDKQTRDSIVQKTQVKVDAIKKLNIPPDAREKRVVDAWMSATKEMMEQHLQKAEQKQDNLYQMFKAGVKPGIEQYQQLKIGPMLLQDSLGNVIPSPVTKSYAEGLDVAGYWTQMHGARKGSVQKVQEVEQPGAFSKMVINNTMGLMINGEDCQTNRGVGLDVGSKDVYDRELAKDLTVRGRTYPTGTLMTPDIVGQIRAADPSAHVVVRSPLKCEHAHGLCRKCAGVSPSGSHYALGTNLGILAAQSLGERAVQLTLKSFHTGGIAGAGGKTLEGFDRIKQLTELPKNIPNAATVAMKSGTVEKVEKDRLGSYVTVSGQRHFVPLDSRGRHLAELAPNTSSSTWTPPKVGQRIEAGDTLSDPSRSVVNPHDLYRATKNMERVQSHLVHELHDIYRPEGVRRQHVETLVRAMSNLTRVVDPGDARHVLKGEFQPASVVRALNRDLVKQNKRPVEHAPVLRGADVVPLEVQEDWMAKMNWQRLRGTLTEAAATAAFSDLHGTHPIPGVAYGAEFGMTSKDKLKKPHLHDIPHFGY